VTATRGSFSGRVLVVAFDGWSDAGSAATAAVDWMLDLTDHEQLAELAAEEFVDFQMHRPRLVFEEDGTRVLKWPDTVLYGPVERPAQVPFGADELVVEEPGHEDKIRYVSGAIAKNVFFLVGAEPSRRWKTYVEHVVRIMQEWQIDHIVILGALFTDAPHSRPITTTITSDNPDLRARYGFEKSEYEGPAGIGSALALAASDAGIEQVSIWASVPHYVHSAPSPKATLALLDQIEELLDVVIPRGDLVEQSNDWEASVSAMAAGDVEMVEYIERLEKARDAFAGPESTGEAIAHEFEKFLRKDSTGGEDGD
jgi:hypothetical protein